MRKLISVLIACMVGMAGYAQAPILVQGRVTDIATGKAFSGVRVAEHDAENRILGDTRTDADGRYMIRITAGNSLVFSSLVDTKRVDRLTKSRELDVALRRREAVDRSDMERFHTDEASFLLVPLMGVQVNRGGGYVTESESGSETLLATGAMLPVSYGGMIGWVKDYGVYAKYRYAETSKKWFSMQSSSLRLGGLFHMEEHFLLYGGAGADLFNMKLNGETLRKTWPALDCGVIYNNGILAVEAGLGYVFSHRFFNAPSHADIGFDFGIGLMF